MDPDARKLLKTDWSHLLSILEERTDEMLILAPSLNEKGLVDWARFRAGERPVLERGLPLNSVKRFCFPQPEELFLFSCRPAEPGAFRLQEPARLEKNTVLFGVRPCDARSIELNRLPYEHDPYFNSRLESLMVIGIPCRETCGTCFCTWTGGGPQGTDGMDAAVWEYDEGVVVQLLSEKGEKFFSSLSATLLSREEFESLFASSFGNLSEDVQNPADLMKQKPLLSCYDAPFWQRVADSCINCGVCTFLCPTCYCFDIQDERLGGQGRRIRYWDSCMFPLFTQHASGHNPRGRKVQRVRNRFMHKLKYFPDRFGPLSCVGCGRCIRECPVNIDIREVLRDLLQVPGEESDS